MTTPVATSASPSPWARAISYLSAHRLLVECAAIAASIAILLVSTLPNLANHPVITDDEVWVMSASYKLAREGVFGSDMFTGFFNADSRYYFNLPGHHFVLALAFKIIGAGVVQARLVGIVYATATLVLAYLLAKRIYGVPAAILTLGLLLFLRFNIGFDTGLPLQEQAVNMRYDLAPIPFMLGGTLALLGGGTPRRADLAGALFGIAALMQFYGAFMMPVAIVILWTEALPRAQRIKAIAFLCGAFALIILPYAIFVLSDLKDYRGQAGTLDNRTDFSSPAFYVKNLIHEPDRFLRPLAFKEIPRGADFQTTQPRFLSLKETLTRRPSAKLGVVVGLPVAIGFLAWRALRQQQRTDRLLLIALVGLVLQLAVVDSTKFFFYWMPVIPFLCIAMSGAVVWILGQGNRQRLQLAASAVTVAVLLVFFAEGSVARINGIRTASTTSVSYSNLTDHIHDYVPAGSKVVGSTSMWWGLRDTDFRSYFLFFYLTRADAGEYKTTISGYLDDFKPEYLVFTRLSMSELYVHLIKPDLENMLNYIEANYTKIQVFWGPEAKGYGWVDIYQRNPGR